LPIQAVGDVIARRRPIPGTVSVPIIARPIRRPVAIRSIIPVPVRDAVAPAVTMKSPPAPAGDLDNMRCLRARRDGDNGNGCSRHRRECEADRSEEGGSNEAHVRLVLYRDAGAGTMDFRRIFRHGGLVGLPLGQATARSRSMGRVQTGPRPTR
jgi:hypothetical protein